MIGNNLKKKSLLRQCPICENKEGEIFYNQRFLLPENHVLPREYDVVHCEKCGFVFADTSADQKTYNVFYQEMSKYEDVKIASGSGENTYDLVRLNEAARDIEKLIPFKSSSILDIGCGNGGLLIELKKLGFTNLTGLDPSPVCVENILSKGIDAYLGGITNENYKLNKKFDFIIFSHVFEHLVDLKSAVKNTRTLLKTEGIVYVETPDASLYQDFYIVPFYYFDTEHINHFSSESLINLFSTQGFDFVISKQKVMRVSEIIDYPAVFCCFKKKERGKISVYNNNGQTKKSILNHIVQSKNVLNSPEIEKLASNKTPIIVFGAGNYTLRLLETTALGKCNIVAFVDNDSKKHGNIINGVKINGKDFLLKNDALIVICSALFSSEIEQEIKSMYIKNQILKINT